MLTLSLSIIGIYLLAVVYRTIAWLYTYRWSRKSTPRKINAHPDDPYLVLLVPALREQTLVRETVEYFSKMSYVDDKLAVVLITTEKENRHKMQSAEQISGFYQEALTRLTIDHIQSINNGLFPRGRLQEVLDILQLDSGEAGFRRIEALYESMPTTADIAAEEVSRASIMGNRVQFHHVHYPETTGGKPSQLNYGVKCLAEIMPQALSRPEETYIGVYDFDSRPDLRTGLYLASTVRQRRQTRQELPVMFQQTQLPLKQLNQLTGEGFQGMMLRGNAVLYMRHAIGLELFRLHLMRWVDKWRSGRLIRALARPIVYGIGAGMFLRLDTLHEVKLFPEPQEDLAMGYRMSMLGQLIEPIPYMNMVEPYDSYKQMFNSFSMTILSSLMVQREKETVRDVPPRKVLREWEKNFLIVKEWMECLLWLLGFPILLIAYIGLFASSPSVLLSLLLLLVPFGIRYTLDMALLEGVIPDLTHNYRGMMTRDNIEIRAGKKWGVVLVAPLQGMMMALPPLKSLQRLFHTAVLGKNLERTKTER